jgi:hypothetical protein
MITEILRTIVMLQALSCFFFAINEINIRYFTVDNRTKLLNRIREIREFLIFMGENNPLLLTYYDDLDGNDNSNTNDNDEELVQPKEKELKDTYETKYLEKFKQFSNDFVFTAEEQEDIVKESQKIRSAFEREKEDKLCSIKKELLIIDAALKNIKEKNEEDEDEDEDEDEEDEDELLWKQVDLMRELEITETTILTDEEIQTKAHDVIVNKKLDQYINNYVLEYTPLGNVIMRYNNDKKSFEYFSNNTIPYRYLEPIGRKYVMTYLCKPIFIDIEDELKKAEEKYDEEQKEKEKKQKDSEKNKSKVVSFKAQFKSYNKDSKDMNSMPMKNRTNKNVLPPQIKANLPDVNKQSSEKMLLKENANRYTWEGRMANFVPLKKIDKKVMNKQLAMTYADFKKMQEGKKNE